MNNKIENEYRILNFIKSKRAWGSIVYNILSGFISIINLTILSTATLFYGFYAYYFAMFERGRVKLVGFSQIKNPHIRLNSDENMNIWGKIKFRLKEPAFIRSIVFTFFVLVTGLLVFILEIVLVCVPIVFIASPIIMLFMPISLGNYQTENLLLGFSLSIVGIMFFIASLYLGYFVAKAQAIVAVNLLSPKAEELENQVNVLSKSRVDLVGSFEVERKRIERDIHDSVQQELVNLSMNIGELSNENKENKKLKKQFDGLQFQVENSLSSLRNILQGIYPKVLEEHGLYAAISELKSVVPFEIYLSESWARDLRFSKDVEATMYFTVTEAINNTVKHANAKKITISLDFLNEKMITLTIIDDGQGGAIFGNGTGLIGLKERATVIGANLILTSPKGGPTVLNWTKEY